MRGLLRITAVRGSSVALILFVMSGVGCEALVHQGDSENPRDWDNQVKIEAAEDVNPDPSIVEVYLTAEVTTAEFMDGVQTTVWAYNGQVPGPRIEANVGDTLIVHLTNNLPVGTSIHWHGVELPAEMDGSNISQLEVPPGETITYEYKVLNPATHWYHPHFTTNEQIDLGLAGPLIFHDANEDAGLQTAGLPVNTELVLMLDDMLLDDETGQPVKFATAQLELDEGDRTLTQREIAAQIMNGREGNVLLVNGKELPSVTLRRGLPQRWRIINVANGRFMRLSIPGHTMYRIGGDGGLIEDAIAIPPIEMVDDLDNPGESISDPDLSVGLLLTPSERADIIWIPNGQPGEELYLEWHDHERGRHSITTDPDNGNVIGLGHVEDDGKQPPKRLMRIELVGDTVEDLALDLPSPLPRSTDSPLVDIRGLVDLDDYGAGVPDDTGQALPVFFGHAAPDSSGAITMFVAVQNRDGLLDAIRAQTALVAGAGGAEVPGGVGPPPFEPRPFPAADNTVALPVTIGDLRFWEVVNFTAADHPFHPHAFFFQPIETLKVHLGDAANNIPSSIETVTYPLEYKDSIRLPARPGGLGRSWTITRLAVRFDDSHRLASPLGLVRSNAQLAASGKVPGGTGTGLPSIGDSGGWVFHCHTNEHPVRGMMSFYNLFLP